MPRLKPSRFPFVALEGTDGSGKSTLRMRLTECLRSRGLTVTEFGQHSWLDPAAARLIIGTRLSRAHFTPAEVTRSSLRDKALHHQHNITPAQTTGPVIVDRYVLSDVVYHNVLHGVPIDDIRTMMSAAPLTPPDLVIFVDTPPDIAWQRVQKRAKQLRPYERPEILTKLHQCYLDVLQEKIMDSEIIHFPNAGDLAPASVHGLADRVMAVMASDETLGEEHEQ